MPTDPKVTPPMNDDRFRIQPKSTFDIAREWLVVKDYEPQGQVFLAKAELLAEFADMLTGQLQFERGNYKKLAEAAEAENTALKTRVAELEQSNSVLCKALDDARHDNRRF